MRSGFALKVIKVRFVAASPPDVRRGYASPLQSLKVGRAVPLVRPLAQPADGLSPDQGHSPIIIFAAVGGA